MAPPRRFTPTELQAHRRVYDQDRRRQDAANPRTCKAARCWKQAAVKSDYCLPHLRALIRYGHPFGGPIAAADWYRMLVRVSRLHKRLDPELLRLAVAEIERIVVAPGRIDPPRVAPRSKNRRALLLNELWRLQHPPASPRKIQRDRAGIERIRRLTPVTALEAFNAAVTAWCCARLPGALTKGRGAGQAIPQLDTREALVYAVGRRVLALRFLSYPYKVQDGKRATNGSLAMSTIAIQELGEQIVTALSPMMPLVEAEIRKTMARAAKRAAGIARNRETKNPTPITPNRFVFTF